MIMLENKNVNNVQETNPEDLMFTGETLIPGKASHVQRQQHLNRYVFASKYAKNNFVLDVACGIGYGSQYLAKNGAKYVIGADVSKQFLGYATFNYSEKNLSYLCLDATRFPFPDNHFDVVVSFETIEHIKNYSDFLSECKRVLKTDGLLIISNPNKTVSSLYLKKNPFHIKEFNETDFRSLLTQDYSCVDMYGQYFINPLKVFLVSLISKIFSIIPKINLLRNILKNHFSLNNKPSEAFSFEHLDPHYSVVPIQNKANFFSAPRFLVAVSKHDEQLTDISL